MSWFVEQKLQHDVVEAAFELRNLLTAHSNPGTPDLNALWRESGETALIDAVEKYHHFLFEKDHLRVCASTDCAELIPQAYHNCPKCIEEMDP